jgi:putative SOS response-associated peptidase YedK
VTLAGPQGDAGARTRIADGADWARSAAGRWHKDQRLGAGHAGRWESDRTGANALRVSARGSRGGPVFNFRSEGRHFDKSNRCLIPASAFFEFTGKKYPKAKHRFTLNGAPFMAIAGIWREGKGSDPPAFTMLTTEPGPDIATYHDRQVIVLRPEQWAAWIDLTKAEPELLRPLPAGSLGVETVRGGSD